VDDSLLVPLFTANDFYLFRVHQHADAAEVKRDC
jgi:hypothetical protein